MRRRWGIISRVVETALIQLGITVLVDPLRSGTPYLLFAWDGAAALYLLLRVWLAWTYENRRGTDGEPWLGDLLSRRFALPFVLVTSAVGAAASYLITLAPGTGGQTVAHAAAVPAIVVAWLILQTGFSERYAREHYSDRGHPAFAFPGTEQPGPIDFAYFSFTVGTSFAASDVEVETTDARRLVLAHSILAFFYNAAILGIAIQVLTGS